MTIATVITEGFGTFGNVNFVVTEGYGDYAQDAQVEAEDFTGAFGGKRPRERVAPRADIEKAVRFLMGEEETAEQVQEIVQPYVAPQREAEPIRINWQAFQHDLHAVQNVLALYQQRVEEMLRDEDDAEALLLL